MGPELRGAIRSFLQSTSICVAKGASSVSLDPSYSHTNVHCNETIGTVPVEVILGVTYEVLELYET